MKLKKIIFIEDDPLDFEIFKASLESFSNLYRIFHEISFEDSFYQKYDPRECIVFLDLRMGNYNGRDIFVEYLRGRGYVTFILSSSDDPNDIKRCEGIGLSGYFQKRSSVDDVSRQIISIVEFVKNNLLNFSL